MAKNRLATFRGVSPMLVLAALIAVTAAEYVDVDTTYCGHIDCTKVATFEGEKFCNPCDTRHYCECKETKEPLPYLRKCPGNKPCQKKDRRGSCKASLSPEQCKHIDG